jgi:hypothetical protein
MIKRPIVAGKATVQGLTTWTCNNFTGRWPVPATLVVTADNIETAIKLVEKELFKIGLSQTIKPEQLVPLPTHHRHVRILSDGDY